MLTFEITPVTDTMITYHVRELLSHQDGIYYFLIPPNRRYLTPRGTDLMEPISQVPGIENLIVCRYSFHITKGHVFTWSEVREPIETILNAA